MNFLNKLLSKLPLNGWKSILGFLGINLAAGQILAVEAVIQAIALPSPASIGNAVAQLLLALGLLHKAVK